jgi:hypothetical protein
LVEGVFYAVCANPPFFAVSLFRVIAANVAFFPVYLTGTTRSKKKSKNQKNSIFAQLFFRIDRAAP